MSAAKVKPAIQPPDITSNTLRSETEHITENKIATAELNYDEITKLDKEVQARIKELTYKQNSERSVFPGELNRLINQAEALLALIIDIADARAITVLVSNERFGEQIPLEIKTRAKVFSKESQN
jgi:hypothetical protein